MTCINNLHSVMIYLMDDAYFERIFNEFQMALKEKGKGLPSVSILANEHREDPFSVLISTIISLRTKDEVTLSASRRLFALANDPFTMLKLSDEEIEKAIYPAGFYKRKAKQIKAISEELCKKYNGRVPSSQEELLALPGVGIKTANLTLNLGFNIKAICVDCHVHQIANRMGWIRTKTPEESVSALEKVMSSRFWIPLNELLVAYGQTICTPISPFCSKCPESKACPKVGVEKSR